MGVGSLGNCACSGDVGNLGDGDLGDSEKAGWKAEENSDSGGCYGDDGRGRYMQRGPIPSYEFCPKLH